MKAKTKPKSANNASDHIEEVPSRGTEPVLIEPFKMQEIRLNILGASPLIYNRMSTKAKRELLLPKPPKNRAEKRGTQKHNPVQEYKDSLYTRLEDDKETRLVFPSPGFKGAVMTAALEIPGVFKSTVGRLLSIVGWQVPIWGVPQLFMTGVKQAGMNRTPDIRTRALLPEWATTLVVRYPVNAFEPASIGNLFAAAGQVCGVGDFRQEKGKGSFGLFSLVSESDPDFLRITGEQGRAAQDAAIEQPQAFDAETAELWQWFEEEIVNRGRGQEAQHA